LYSYLDSPSISPRLTFQRPRALTTILEVTSVRDQDLSFSVKGKNIASIAPLYAANVGFDGELKLASASCNEAAQESAHMYTKPVRLIAAASEGLRVKGNRVIGPRQATIANLAGGATLTDLINQITAILAMLRAQGVISRSYGRTTTDRHMLGFGRLGEYLRLQLRCEAFNVGKHPALGNPGTSFGTASFGRIDEDTNRANPARQFQLAAVLAGDFVASE
jgi:hypothetical protein